MKSSSQTRFDFNVESGKSGKDVFFHLKSLRDDGGVTDSECLPF